MHFQTDEEIQCKRFDKMNMRGKADYLVTRLEKLQRELMAVSLNFFTPG